MTKEYTKTVSKGTGHKHNRAGTLYGAKKRSGAPKQAQRAGGLFAPDTPRVYGSPLNPHFLSRREDVREKYWSTLFHEWQKWLQQLDYNLKKLNRAYPIAEKKYTAQGQSPATKKS